MLCTKIVFCFCFDIQNNIFTQLVLNLYFWGDSMNNLSSYNIHTYIILRGNRLRLKLELLTQIYVPQKQVKSTQKSLLL